MMYMYLYSMHRHLWKSIHLDLFPLSIYCVIAWGTSFPLSLLQSIWLRCSWFLHWSPLCLTCSNFSQCIIGNLQFSLTEITFKSELSPGYVGTASHMQGCKIMHVASVNDLVYSGYVKYDSHEKETENALFCIATGTRASFESVRFEEHAQTT